MRRMRQVCIAVAAWLCAAAGCSGHPAYHPKSPARAAIETAPKPARPDIESDMENRPAPVRAPAERPPLTVAAIPAQFVIAQSADDWVRQTFAINDRYRRVIIVDQAKKSHTEVEVPALDLHHGRSPGRPGQPARKRERLRVDVVVSTLQEAADIAEGGDLIAVMPGEYAGFTLGKRPGVGQGAYIRVVALGKPGEVRVTSGSAEDKNWMVHLRGAQYVIVEGLHPVGRSRPGQPAEDTPKAGIFIDGDFGRSGDMAHHIAVIGVLSQGHRKWGFHSTDSHTVLIQDSVFAYSGLEHGAYVSDGSDNYVIRRNVFLGNRMAGLQANLDPTASFHELVTHPDMARLMPLETTRAWVLAAMEAANARFGEGNYPDGRGVNFWIEGNVATGNGAAGAAAFNFAGLSLSTIQNNLIYGNSSSGIAMWDDENAFDAPYREEEQHVVEQGAAPDSVPMFGCQGNLVRHNTILMSVRSRPALQAANGSWGMRIFNNIIVNDTGPSIEIFHTSMHALDSGRNVIGNVVFRGPAARLRSASTAPPDETHLRASMTSHKLAPELMQAVSAPAQPWQPWILLDAAWWADNPKRPDLRPQPGSRLLVGTADPAHLPSHDLAGNPRVQPVVGAFEPPAASATAGP